jgi:hypothetical protein
MAMEYTRLVTDDEEAAILYYVPRGVKAHLDELIDAGLGHTLASYAAVAAKVVEAEAVAMKAKYEKLEKADKDIVDAALAKASVAVEPGDVEPMEGP